MQPIFITGIGTGIGKTIVSAIITEALQADYWKPVQAGYEHGTDSEWVRNALTGPGSVIHPELYKLKLAASPHLAAADENTRIDLTKIKDTLHELLRPGKQLIIEGAGGLMVPLNETEFVADLIRQLDAKVILVSRNYLGSINHSLLTAEVCKQYKLDVAGWIFNDDYMSYEDEIVHWSGFPKIASIPFTTDPGPGFIRQQATIIKEGLQKLV